MKIFIKLQAYWRLGFVNIARVAIYRIGLRTGLHPVVYRKANIAGTKFFEPVAKPDTTPPLSEIWDDHALYFGWYRVLLDGKPPLWHTNPFNGESLERPNIPWWRIRDFSLKVGDIKTLWEASRFDWVLAQAQRARTGNASELERLNQWLADWCQTNPAFQGPNWKCGQEASIRVMHLAMASRLLGQDGRPCPDLMCLVQAHLSRIFPTLSYAQAQDNNHGISEAAALFIGGSWCQANGIAQGARWAMVGRRSLENRCRRLIELDGSFSQYSLNYHRVLLDTLCMAELWRRWQGLEEFSSVLYARAKAAVHWLYTIVDPERGDAPNLGANDGARLLSLTDTDFRDFRPSVQLAMALFANMRAYAGEGAHNLPLAWLGIALPDQRASTPSSEHFQNGGYTVLRHDHWMVLFRFPRYKFRPRHCDGLHVDLWHGSYNLLRDGGSYSYNTDEQWQAYFPGTVAHNTVQFDDRDQMPRLGRFLRGGWLRAVDMKPVKEIGGSISVGAGYCDWKRACHHRSVHLEPKGLHVRDRVSGFDKRAVLRWRLLPGRWQLENNTARCGKYALKISADVPIARCELIDGWESRYYMKKSSLPVLEVEVNLAGTLCTEFTCAEAQTQIRDGAS